MKVSGNHEHRSRTKAGDSSRRNQKAVSGSDDLIARSHAESHKDYQQRIGPGRHPNCVPALTVFGDFPL